MLNTDTIIQEKQFSALGLIKVHILVVNKKLLDLIPLSEMMDALLWITCLERTKSFFTNF